MCGHPTNHLVPTVPKGGLAFACRDVVRFEDGYLGCRLAFERCVQICWKSGSEASRTHGPAPRAELLHVLMLPDFDRADRIGSYWDPEDADLRRAPDRLRGGPEASGGARRDVAGG